MNIRKTVLLAAVFVAVSTIVFTGTSHAFFTDDFDTRDWLNGGNMSLRNNRAGSAEASAHTSETMWRSP